MSEPNLDADDYAELARMLREWLEADKYFLSTQHKRRRVILLKIQPEPERVPLPLPKPPGEPSLALQRKRRRR